MDIIEYGIKAKNATKDIMKLTTKEKNDALLYCADALCKNAKTIIEANAIDIKNGKENGMSEGILDRLLLTEERISNMANGIRKVVSLPDNVGEVINTTKHQNGMSIEKVRTPLGVVGMIYESRPNVTSDSFALCFKTNNCVILRAGKDAINSNIAITKVLRDSLKELSINEDAVLLVKETDHETANKFMKMKEYVDVLIPRGGAKLIQAVINNATIPVIETGTGNCHIYVDDEADLEMAVKIIENAKTQRLGVCNACESLVINKNVLDMAMPMIAKMLKNHNIKIYADEEAYRILSVSDTGAEFYKATEDDFYTEYLDRKISVKIVNNLEEAINHINEHNTKHSESIITENVEKAQIFLNSIDAACVYWNVSTRFSDGEEFGLGAEIGISTQKLHARGPFALEALTTYKYIIKGNGQVRK